MLRKINLKNNSRGTIDEFKNTSKKEMKHFLFIETVIVIKCKYIYIYIYMLQMELKLIFSEIKEYVIYDFKYPMSD